MRQKQTDKTKYGSPDNDIIAQSLEKSSHFCHYNCVKYMTRVVNIEQMNFVRRNFYMLILHKGGRSDIRKIKYYLSRLEESKWCAAYFHCSAVMDRIYGSSDWEWK